MGDAMRLLLLLAMLMGLLTGCATNASAAVVHLNDRQPLPERPATDVVPLRPGVVAFPLGFGHWASGATDVLINDQLIKGDPRCAVPLHLNAAMRIDPHLGNVTLSDLAGGSAVFYDSKVKVEKA
jgi:hypothetical protein